MEKQKEYRKTKSEELKIKEKAQKKIYDSKRKLTKEQEEVKKEYNKKYQECIRNTKKNFILLMKELKSMQVTPIFNN